MTTVIEPAVEVERASREHVAALMLKAVRDHGLTWPKSIDFMSDLWVEVETVAEVRQWMGVFGTTYDNNMPQQHPELPIIMHWTHLDDFHGWYLRVKANEPAARNAPDLDAETAALIDEVTATRTCEVVHPLGCPGDLDGPTVALPTSAVTPCDPELAETIAHRHDPAQIVEHVTVDPDLDAGRGDAEIARIGVPVDLTRLSGTVESITDGAS